MPVSINQRQGWGLETLYIPAGEGSRLHGITSLEIAMQGETGIYALHMTVRETDENNQNAGRSPKENSNHTNPGPLE